MDRHLRTVADDLCYLKTWGPEISDGEIRRGSAVLRRLLTEGVYGHAWRAAGFDGQPSILAVDISDLAAHESSSEIVLALAGGAHFRGVQIARLVMNKGSKTLDVPRPVPLTEDGYPGEKYFRIYDFITSLSGIIEGKPFSRNEVIKYVANVRGGVHLSRKLRRAEQKLVEKLAKIDDAFKVHTTYSLLYEIVAIGQAVARSPDTAKFINKVAKYKAR